MITGKWTSYVINYTIIKQIISVPTSSHTLLAIRTLMILLVRKSKCSPKSSLVHHGGSFSAKDLPGL